MSAVPDCYRHPGVAGTNHCSVCRKPTCDTCLTWSALAPACPPCARRHRQRTGTRQMLVVGGVLAIGCSGILVAMLTYEKPFDYGAHSGTVIVLRQQLAAQPCDRTAIVKLGDTMVVAGDDRGALDRANEWLETCGEYERLRWVTYGALKRLGEDDAAIREASKLIELDPDDKDYWWWRGIVYERTGQLARAAADYEKSLEIQPRLNAIPFNLSYVYEKMGKPCEAALAVERHLEHHPDVEPDASLSHRLARLQRGCGARVTSESTPSGNPTGRIELQGAAISLPDGFTALADGWENELDGVPVVPAASKGFVRVTAAGDTLVKFRVVDGPREGGKTPRLPELVTAMRAAGRTAGSVVRQQTKERPRWIELGLSFDRDRNAGEFRAFSGFLEPASQVRTWMVHCEDRPATTSTHCQDIVASLLVVDSGTLRLFSDVYAE